MSQYTEEYEDTDAEYLDAFDIEEDDDDDDEEEFFDDYAEEDDDDDDEEAFGDFDSLEGYDDDDGESLAERRRFRFRRRGYPMFRRRRFRRRFRKPRRLRSVGAIRRAVIRTPAGSARIRLPKAVATRSSVNSRLKEIKQEIGRNTKAIKKVDTTLEKNTGIVDKKINAVSSDLRKSNKKMREQLQQATLMPLLLQKTPKIDTATLQNVDANGNVVPGTDQHVKVTNHKFPKDSSSLLPLIFLMGGTDGGGSSNMLMMALILSGGLGNK